MNKLNNIETAFLRSASTEQNPFNTTEETLAWIQQQNREILVDVKQIPFSECTGWEFDKDGNLRHQSGKFFSIEGLNVHTNYGEVPTWQQPIINQPEIGYLGIICKEFNGVLYFLLQAKVEPGNINNVQLSPTLQATKSNYSQVHGGNKPPYLEYFQQAKPEQILLDQLQSEQGARFLKKRNRNIIIRLSEDIELKSNFIWLTLGQIKKLAQHDNVVNMDTRTVISGIPLYSDDCELLKRGEPKNSTTEILSWMTSMKCRYDLNTQIMPLKDVAGWETTDMAIQHKAGKYFKVIAAQVSINNREVKTWNQPLVQPMQQGLTAFIVKKINGTYHFLVQGKVELGNFDVVEMAPTVQCITDSYSGHNNQPYVDYVLRAQPNTNPQTPNTKHHTPYTILDTLQSEEGGRFYQEQNRNMIIIADDTFDTENIPDNYMWITHEQLMLFMHFNNYLNIQARSLLSLIGV